MRGYDDSDGRRYSDPVFYGDVTESNGSYAEDVEHVMLVLGLSECKADHVVRVIQTNMPNCEVTEIVDQLACVLRATGSMQDHFEKAAGQLRRLVKILDSIQKKQEREPRRKPCFTAPRKNKQGRTPKCGRISHRQVGRKKRRF